MALNHMAQNKGVELQRAVKVLESLVALIRQGRPHQHCQNPVFECRSNNGSNRLDVCSSSVRFETNYQTEARALTWRVKLKLWYQGLNTR